KREPYKWTGEQQHAFEILKRHLIMTPILRYSDFNKMFILHMDASSMDLGAVLVQKDEDNREYVVAYASRGLSKLERNYSALELEY
ncbi:16653_t:CDS:1, partial [Gigaspora rosea]